MDNFLKNKKQILNSSNDSLAKAFTELKNEVIQKPTTRTVSLTLVVRSNCGCSPDAGIDILREVPIDSDYNDGDIVFDKEDGDVFPAYEKIMSDYF